MSEPEDLAGALVDATSVLVFTGAGISTGSGIPDFRGPNGMWKNRAPVYFDEFMNSEEARIRHWQYKAEMHQVFTSARPNAAHLGLAELERLGLLEVLVTQNIDGLHHDAGNRPDRIVEIHGTNRWIECMTCKARTAPDPAMAEFTATGKPPVCPCGGFLKSATISFGQPMPQEELARAFRAAEEADLVIAIGSTLEVHPAASVPLVAIRHGARYAIVNRGPTAHDHLAAIRIEGDAVEIVPRVLSAIRARRP